MHDEEEYHNWSKHLASDPIDFIAANGFDFVEGCIIKYVSRYKYKDGLRDLYKARAYLERLIAREEGKPYVYQYIPIPKRQEQEVQP
jgi:hypothetical protein